MPKIKNKLIKIIYKNKKFWLVFLFMGIFVLAFFLVLNLRTQAADSDYTYTLSGNNATITAYSGAGGALTIPSTLDSHPVVAIGASAFLNKTTITSAVIPNGVISIGDGAFKGCTFMTSVTIPNSVTTLSNSVFSSCVRLTSVTIPSSVTSIGDNVFYYCRLLTQIIVDSSNPSYLSEDGVLYNKTKTLFIAYPAAKSGASYVIPNSVASISMYAFSYNSQITSVTIGSSVTSIGRAAFGNCTKLVSIYFLGNAPTLGLYGFINCASGFTINYISDKTGWANPWNAYPAATFLDPSKTITTFNFNGLDPAVTGGVNETAKTVALTVPYGTNLTALVPTIGIDGASISPASGVAQNFTSTQTYTVTADDATTQSYTVTVTFEVGFAVSAISGSTTEAGNLSTFTVVLQSQPTADVIISSITSSDTTEGTVSPDSLTFTNSNWNAPRTVTVTGIDDSVQDGDIAYTIITSAATSADSNYNGLNPNNVAVINIDNDIAGFAINIIDNQTGEDLSTGSFSISLTSQPTANVTIPLSSDNSSEGTIAVSELVFTSLNWGTPQTVTVTGVNDDASDGPINYNIVTGDPTSTGDSVYNALGAGNIANISMTNQDNDPPGITVTPLDTFITTEAVGGTARFNIVLLSQPSANVTMVVSSSDTTEGTVSSALLTFTNGNWSTPQTITVTGADDFIDDGDVAYQLLIANCVSADPAYSGRVVADPTLINTDNDTAGFTVTAISGATTEAPGGTATLTVVLISEPTANVVVGVSSSDTSEGTVSAASLTFTSANWDTPQTITVTGVNDSIQDGNIEYSIVFAPAVSDDTVYNNLKPNNVTATNTDNDFVLTYTAGTGGAISGITPQTINSGANGTLVTAVPDTNYHFVEWSDNHSAVATRTDTGVTDNLSATASFAIDTHTLAYTAGANGTITGTASQTINYGSSGTEVTATPSAGYHFVKWGDDSTDNPRTDINVTTNIAVAATFAINLTSDKIITAFDFTTLAVTGVIDEGTKTVVLTVPFDTNITALVPTISITGSSVSPASGVANNFTTPQTYTVTANDLSAQNYTVTVALTLTPEKSITAFIVPSQIGSTTISEDTHAIALIVPGGVDVTAIAPTIAIAGSSVSPPSGVANNFITPQAYTVAATDGSIQSYTVTVSISSISPPSYGGGGGGRDTTPPTNTSVSINNGADTTLVRDIILTLRATDVFQMMVANSTDFLGSSWESFNALKNWTLTIGDGVKTVYAKFQDSSKNVSGIVFDSINLETISGLQPEPISNIGEYVVTTQDILMGIAQKLYGDSEQWKRLLELNPSLTDSNLSVGSILKYDINGGLYIPKTIKETISRAYDYELVNQSPYPKELNPGETTNVWIEVKNTGTATWFNSGADIVRLGSGSQYGSINQQRDYMSEFANSDWLSNDRPVGISDSKVEPGGRSRFQFNIRVPSMPGTYKAYFTPVADGITWMRDIGIYWEIKVVNMTLRTGQYIVSNGDSLSSIAAKLYGDQSKYLKLIELNKSKYPTLLFSPDVIGWGWILDY